MVVVRVTGGWGWCRSLKRSLNRHRAGNDLVLQHDADHQEDEVQHEHDEAEQLAHAPLAGGNGDDDKEQHEEEEHDCAEEAVGADLHGCHAAEKGPQEPGERQSASTQTHVLLLYKQTTEAAASRQQAHYSTAIFTALYLS